MSKAGAAGATVTFAVTAGSLPAGLTMPAQGGSGTVITGNPTQAGTFNFTIKATDGGLTSTLAYQITVTVQGPPDQLLCDPPTTAASWKAGCACCPTPWSASPTKGTCPPATRPAARSASSPAPCPAGLSLPATFGPSGDVVGGTHPAQHRQRGYNFTVQGTGDQGQPLYQTYRSTWTRTSRWPSALPGGGSTLSPGMVGGAYAQNFFLSGGAHPTPGPWPPGNSRLA